MYKVLLVDDEEIEREAMAEIIPWKKVGLQLVDMAWNGIEALEKIRQTEPDIVITDIKMPVMDGIELIRRAKELNPHLFFVVLSGYGEYGYTSKAMELGIRHYILKPCDEDKIVEVLLNVKNELQDKEEKEKSEKEIKNSVQRMLPHFKERILYELITKKELSLSDQMILEKFTKDIEDDFILLSVRSPQEFGQLDCFVLGNILSELLGEDQIYMSFAFRKEVLYLIPAALAQRITPLIKRAHEEYFKYNKVRLHSAASKRGRIRDSSKLYCQIQELFYFSEMDENQEILQYDLYGNETENGSMAIDYTGIRNAETYEDLMFEIYCSSAKMELKGISLERMWEIYNFSLKILFGEDAEDVNRCSSVWELLEQVIERCALQMNLKLPDTKDGIRLKTILSAIYQNFKNPDLSLQYLAQNVLFMNEDYFGRFFFKYMNERYSSFLVRIRILLVQRLVAYKPDIKVSQLAVQTGYPEDGQYLTKVFKKQTGMLLSDYRKVVKKN